MTNNSTSSRQLSELAVAGILEKKGHDIVILDLSGIDGSVSDYFVICHGNSRPQVEALVDSVDETVKKATGQNPYHVEGSQNAEWVLIDYVDVVIHVFMEDTRKFFRLEELWGDAPRKEISADA
jgi:ribosome-associated protein